MPYPPNLNTTDPRSPEYAHCDRDDALAALEEMNLTLSKAGDEIYNAACVWEDCTATDQSQEEAAALAPHIAARVTDFPACLERGANPVGLDRAGDLLELALRLMKCRMTTRTAHFRKDLEDHVRLLRGYVTAIEQEEGRGK